MKIMVPIKRVIDYNLRVKIRSDGSGVDLSGLKMSINPFDEIAVEEAVRLKEAGFADEVVLVSIGVSQTQDTLRTGLAMGAERAIHVVTDGPVETDIEPLSVAKILAKIAQQEEPDLIICGKQAIDNDMNATPQMLAALLGWGQAMFANSVSLTSDHAEVAREIDGGLQTIRVKLPAVISTDLRLNEPRYASLPNIMKAKKKPIDQVQAISFAHELEPRLEVIATDEPPVRKSGVVVSSVDELVAKMREVGVA